MAEIKKVEQFAPAGSEADQLLAYPFEAPQHSYITDGETVTQVPDDYELFVSEADKLLEKQGLSRMAERIPIIEYGSNVSPYQTRAKMGKFGTPEQQKELQTTPKITSVILDANVVWHGKPGQKGSTFAEIYKDDTTDDTEAPCLVAFMDEKQLAVMHTTEGVTYHAVLIDVLAGEDRHPMQALAYVAGNSTVLLKGGKPIPVQRPGAKQIEGAMTAEQAVNYMIEHAGYSIPVEDARELVKLASTKDLAGKKELQKPVESELAQRGLNKTFKFQKEPGTAVGRADFNSIKPQGGHDVLRLMEEVVASLRPSKEELHKKAAEFESKGNSPEQALKKARATIDIAEQLRKRASEELGIPLASEKPKPEKAQ